MDADFLVFYRIDLRDPATRITAESFFARAFRLFNYRGALRDRLQAEHMENEEHGGPPPVVQSSTPAPAPAPKTPDRDGTRWVSANEMQALYPDLF